MSGRGQTRLRSREQSSRERRHISQYGAEMVSAPAKTASIAAGSGMIVSDLGKY